MSTKTSTATQTQALARPAISPIMGGVLQRQCACGQHTMSGGECAVCKQKRDGTLQRAAVNPSFVHEVPPIMHKVLRSPGKPLDAATRAFMEPRFGHDISGIPTYTSVAGVIQTKLTINKPGDEYEQEADRIANQVMATSQYTPVGNVPTRIQRFVGQPTAQVDTVPASVDRALASPGRPLDPALQQDMGQRFGYDFSRVRVHSGAAAEQSVREVNAYAYAVGHNIVFGAGLFAPGTHEGRRLIAHELTHVVQQSGSDGSRVGQSNDKLGLSPAIPLDLEVPRGGIGGPPVVRRADAKEDMTSNLKDDSARFEDDKKLEDVTAGADKVSKGSRGLTVTKLQQALVDLGYLPASAVDGKFEGQTKAALLKFQKDKVITESGELDAATMKELHAAYDTRKPYVDKAKHDAMNPGTHALSATDKTASLGAMVPAPSLGAPSTFTEDLGPPKGKYGPRIQARLTTIIAALHKNLFEDKKPLRADPAKNFHDWAALEGPAMEAKKVVDKVYDSNYGGAAAKPPMTHAGGNLIDQWDDEIARNVGLTAGPGGQQADKARDKVWYLINSNCKTINGEHSAVPSAATEKGILSPIVESFVSDATKVQTMLDLDIGWKGAELEGKVYLQRYKSTESNATKAKEANRVQMWELFQTCIHEYLHTLAHSDFHTWANSFRLAGDDTRYNTLVEGFADFFTLNVRTTVAPATVQATVEGPYANGNPPPVVHPGIYPSHAQAEQVISVVGIKNAQAAYFRGKTNLIGAP